MASEAAPGVTGATGAAELGAFETLRAARVQWEVFDYKLAGVTTPQGAYIAGFKAGAVWAIYTSGKLSHPEFQLAVRVLAEVLQIERGAPVETGVRTCRHCGVIG